MKASPPTRGAAAVREQSVAVVVLTYNRLPLLKECIAALNAQTRLPDAIVVVDNGSESDTGDWLQTQSNLTVVSLQPNAGPAAGMKRGLEEAYNGGYTWIWAMDDDGLPHPAALQKLLEARPDVVGAKNSMVLDKADGKSMAFKLKDFKTLNDVKEPYVEGEIMPWNGTLFHRRIIEQLGYPRAELFLWGEEMEYYYRIKTSGQFPLFSVRDSWHFHPRNKGFFYKGEWNVRTHDRAYFFIRNKYAVYLSAHRKNKLKASLHYLLFNAAMVYYIFFRQPAQKGKKLKLLWAGGRDGIAADYSKKPADVQRLLQRL